MHFDTFSDRTPCMSKVNVSPLVYTSVQINDDVDSGDNDLCRDKYNHYADISKELGIPRCDEVKGLEFARTDPL